MSLPPGAQRVLDDLDPGPWKSKALAGAGSGRRFWRAQRRGRSCVIGWSPDGDQHRRVVGIGRALELEGVPVPHLIGADNSSRVTVHEDAGPRSLLQLARGHDGPAGDPAPTESPGPAPLDDDARAAYERAVDVLVHLGDVFRAPPPVLLTFGIDDLRWETWYGLTHQLGGSLGIARPPEGLEDELAQVAQTVAGGPSAAMHRDFQSTNLHVDDEGELAVLDWEGARWGPAIYDLVSLLWDPYVSMDEDDRARLIERWNGHRGVPNAEGELLAATTVQRLLQAAGAFAFLPRHRGRSGFAPYGSPALAMAAVAAAPWPRLAALLAEGAERTRA